ncbi:hypothetical protein BJX99DRAFT_33247 [Aspergillus californicus]
MKSVLSFTALQLLASYVSALPLADRDIPWHITVPKVSPVKRQSLPTTWDPPSDLVTPLNEVWEHEVSTYSDALGFENYGFDQVIAGGGKINYCVRWDSSETVTAAQREKIATAASRSYNKWIAGLAGFDDWPYDTVAVEVVGYAVRDTSLLEGDTTGLDIYTTTDADGIPECDPVCGRFFHQDGDYSSCPGGDERHYDESLWLTDGFEGGAGGDWGQRVGQEYFMENLDTEDIHIYLHEIGHTFALDDFYDWTPTGVTSFIMLAGSATEITEFDLWMLRDWWRNLNDRYDLSATTTVASSSKVVSSTSTAVAVPTASPTSSFSAVPSPSIPAVATPTPTFPSASPSPEDPATEQPSGSPWGEHSWSEESSHAPWWRGHSWWGKSSRS